MNEKELLEKVERVRGAYFAILHRLAEIPDDINQCPEREVLKKRAQAVSKKYQDLMLRVRDIDIYKREVEAITKELNQKLTWQKENYEQIDQLAGELLEMPELM